MRHHDRKTLYAAAVAVLTAGLLGAGPAQAYDVNDKLEINGKGFVDWTQAEDDADSGFHFTRAYYEMRYHSDADNMIRFTLDQKEPDTTVFVKYVYWQHKMGDHKIKVGQTHTPLVDYLQTHMWGHRYVAKTFTDDVKAATSADLGVAVLGKVGDNFEYDVSVMNGEGYTKTTDGNGYALRGRIEGKASGFHVGLYGHTETERGGTANYDPTRELVYAYYDNGTVRAGGQYLMADDGSGGSTFNDGTGYNVLVNVKLPTGEHKSEAFARYDSIDPMDTGTDTTLTIAGVEIEAAKGVMFAPNVQVRDDGTTSETTWGVNGQIKF
jgi:hypothetical protein